MAIASHERAVPGFTRPVFVGIVMVLLGVLLAAFNLSRGAVEDVGSLPDPEDRERHTFYYVAGQARGPSNWEAYRIALEEGRARNYAISEADLNQWAARRLQPPPPSGDDDGTAPVLQPSNVNFRLVGDRLQIGLDLEVSIPFVGGEQVLYVVEGSFERHRGGYRFVPERANINQCAIPLGALRQFAFNRILKSADMEEIDALAAQWSAIRNLRIEDERLHFSLEE